MILRTADDILVNKFTFLRIGRLLFNQEYNFQFCISVINLLIETWNCTHEVTRIWLQCYFMRPVWRRSPTYRSVSPLSNWVLSWIWCNYFRPHTFFRFSYISFKSRGTTFSHLDVRHTNLAHENSFGNTVCLLSLNSAVSIGL